MIPFFQSDAMTTPTLLFAALFVALALCACNPPCQHDASTILYAAEGTCGASGFVAIHSAANRCGVLAAFGEHVGLPGTGEFPRPALFGSATFTPSAGGFALIDLLHGRSCSASPGQGGLTIRCPSFETTNACSMSLVAQ